MQQGSVDVTPAQNKRVLLLHKKAMEAAQRYWTAKTGTETKVTLSYRLDEAEREFKEYVAALSKDMDASANKKKAKT